MEVKNSAALATRESRRPPVARRIQPRCHPGNAGRSGGACRRAQAEPQSGLIQKVRRYIESQYEDSSLSLIGLAENFGVSEAYMSRAFKLQTGENFNEFVEKLRLGKARTLLEETELPVNRIGAKVGYNSANTFARAFKRRFGVSASEYREKHRRET
ncbi:helix-turn-helix domain-containing protein [Cohnella hongkongensis]|uniref:Helix-turn-helix domain-containing protein n=1 Tax=Cohnella hongkongensis TaxID=178337 RepID=A0ABV9FAR9_9BACL